ncbi:MAG: NAD(P)-binding domain-containing protein, partial [Candidatus Rokubacteria bacterium]|nr:NAD(P)-binding domain-containing protein [Candidatus Rokubacteria bacterium]
MSVTVKIGVIGAGVLGSALARLLAARGYPVVAVSSRRLERAETLAVAVGAEAHRLPHEVAARADLTLLTLPDDQIGPVAAEVARAGGWGPGKAAVHTSGALDRSVLAPAAERGAWTGGLHPLLAAADPDQALQA